jgi:cytochrome P450
MPIHYNDLPGPKGLPLIGNLHQVRFSTLHQYFEKQALQYGDVFKVKLGPTRLTVISRPELIHRILKSRPNHFRRMTKLDNVLQAEGIHGVFNAEGDAWKVHRRIVTRGLDIKHQQQFFPAMTGIVRRLHKKLQSAADTGTPCPIKDELKRFTVDVTTSLAFGVDMNTLGQQGGVIQDQMELIFPTIFKRINNPFPLHRIYKTKKDKAYDHAMREVEQAVHDFIKSGKERLAKNPALREKPENILDALLVAADEETSINDREIKSNLLTLLLAGEDTTAHSLAWALYFTCQHPDVQHKLQQEADAIIGDGICLDQYEKQDELVYTTSVIQEALRLKSVAPIMLVEPLDDIVFDDYQFSKGSGIALLVRSGAMRDQYFTASESFNPKRWMKDETAKRQCPVHNLDAFFPFGSGPRLCPGKNLAMLEMKLVLSMLMKNFTIEMITPAQEVGEHLAFTMMPADFFMAIKRRDSPVKL